MQASRLADAHAVMQETGVLRFQMRVALSAPKLLMLDLVEAAAVAVLVCHTPGRPPLSFPPCVRSGFAAHHSLASLLHVVTPVEHRACLSRLSDTHKHIHTAAQSDPGVLPHMKVRHVYCCYRRFVQIFHLCALSFMRVLAKHIGHKRCPLQLSSPLQSAHADA